MVNARMKRYISYVLVFILFLCLMLLNLNRIAGFVDENDNFLAGLTIAKGGMVYQDFLTQHMPVLYYICGLFAKLGASNSVQFRLYFYVFFAVLWTLFYIRYKEKIGSRTIILGVLFYVACMSATLNSCVLSDQIQAFGMVVLMVEFLLFVKSKSINFVSCVWISLAVFLSFGSAFVAAFAIFMILVGVAGIEISNLIGSGKKFIVWLKEMILKYWKLVVIVLLPFAVLILYYAFNHNLYEFYFGAYRINRSIYPKYLDYGSNILTTFLQPIEYWFQFLSVSINSLFTSPLESIRSLICLGINVVFIKELYRKSKFVAIICAAFCIMCGSRYISMDFHALPYLAVTVFMASVLLQNSMLTREKELLSRKTINFSVLCLILIFITPLMSNFSSITKVGETISYSPTKDKNNYAYYVSNLTEEDDRVLLTTVEPGILVDSQRQAIPVGISTPWTYEAYGKNDMANIQKYNPKIAIYDSEYEIWGYKITEYAPEICDFIEKNYTQLLIGSISKLYIRNDLYEDAINKFSLDTEATVTTGKNDTILALQEPVEQIFTAAGESISRIRLLIGTYGRTNNSAINFKIVNLSDDGVIFEKEISANHFEDNAYNLIEKNTIKLVPGEKYKMIINPIRNTENDYIALYITDNTNVSDDGEGESDKINGYIPGENYNLCLKFDYSVC